MRGLSDRRPSLYAGRMLGGTSMLNAMVYMRGHKSDYDEWESLGCRGWGYDDILPYFKKSEGFRPVFDLDHRYHGADVALLLCLRLAQQAGHQRQIQ